MERFNTINQTTVILAYFLAYIGKWVEWVDVHRMYYSII